MPTRFWILLCLALVLPACTAADVGEGRRTPQVTASSFTSTPLPPSATPTPAFTATPRPTATRTLTPTPDQVALLRSALEQAVASTYWSGLNLSEERQAAWQDFAAGKASLPPEEFALLEELLDLLEPYLARLPEGVLPKDAQPALRLASFSTESGERLVPYLVDESSPGAAGEESLFLPIRPTEDGLPAFMIAPQISGLTQHISQDGRYVEYLDPDGKWVLRADARRLDIDQEGDYITNLMLDPEYPAGLNTVEYVYPRFRLNIPDIETSFYAVEHLTTQQISLLKHTLEVFNQPEIEGFKPLIFSANDNITYVVSRIPHGFNAAEAIGYTANPPRGVTTLYSRNLFDNRYMTAASIAHEAAHVWQGETPKCEKLEARRIMEIGNQTIPEDFDDWTPQQLYLGIVRKQIGAYHVSLWVLRKLNVRDMAEFEERIIYTGHLNGIPVFGCNN